MSNIQAKGTSNEPESDRQAGANTRPWAAGTTGQARSPSRASGSCARPAESSSAASPARGRLVRDPWWVQCPERLEYELAALEKAGIHVAPDESALDAGVMRLHLKMAVGAELLPLVVTFPDLYPYFRFHVEAPTLSLAHHQNPFNKNLCLLGRATHHWATTDTVAELLQRQLPQVLSAGQATSIEAVAGIEQQQAEPFSEYYIYAPSMIMAPQGAVFPTGHPSGSFTIKMSEAVGPPPGKFVRGMISEVRSGNNEVLFTSDPRVLLPFSGPSLEGYWVRTTEPIPHADHEKFLADVLERCPEARKAKVNHVTGGYLQLWAIVFPEERAWRDVGDDGIVFCCRFSSKRDGMVHEARPVHPPHFVKPHKKKNRR